MSFVSLCLTSSWLDLDGLKPVTPPCYLPVSSPANGFYWFQTPGSSPPPPPLVKVIMSTSSLLRPERTSFATCVSDVASCLFSVS